MEVAVSKLGGMPVTLSVGGEAWAMEYEDGTVMDGAAAEHVREGAGVLGRYCDILGVRSFPQGKDYAKDRGRAGARRVRPAIRACRSSTSSRASPIRARRWRTP